MNKTYSLTEPKTSEHTKNTAKYVNALCHTDTKSARLTENSEQHEINSKYLQNI